MKKIWWFRQKNSIQIDFMIFSGKYFNFLFILILTLGIPTTRLKTMYRILPVLSSLRILPWNQRYGLFNKNPIELFITISHWNKIEGLTMKQTRWWFGKYRYCPFPIWKKKSGVTGFRHVCTLHLVWKKSSRKKIQK